MIMITVVDENDDTIMMFWRPVRFTLFLLLNVVVHYII